jgi:diguanylate cyclase (GGDEF)-like protein
MMARYGGEEFVGILPDIDVEGARVLAERWRANVAALALPHQHSKAENYVTISVGYASLRPTQYQSPMELVEKADKMLYQAKELGRNRVCGALM